MTRRQEMYVNAVKAVIARLPERHRDRVASEFATFSEAVSRIRRELVDIHEDNEGPEWTLGVWIRGLARSDFEKITRRLGAQTWAASWDAFDIKLATGRKTAFFLMNGNAVNQTRAALRGLDALATLLDDAGVGPIDAIRFEVESFERLAQGVTLEDERDVQAYLDDTIRFWRRKHAKAKRDYDAVVKRDQRSRLDPGTTLLAKSRLAEAANVAKAEHYIDAFQSARKSIIGSTLPEEAAA